MGITMARTSPGTTGCRHPRQPPRRAHPGRVAARSRRAGATPPELPLVALVVSGGHHVPRGADRRASAIGCWARPWTTRRARRSTRWAGCWGCPIPAAHPSWPPLLGHPPRPSPSPSLDGRLGDFSFSGLKTAVRGWSPRCRRWAPPRTRSSPMAAGCRRRPWPRSHGRSRIGHRRARYQDPPRRPSRRAPGASWWAGGVAANRVLRERIAAGAQELTPARRAPCRALHHNGATIGAAGISGSVPAPGGPRSGGAAIGKLAQLGDVTSPLPPARGDPPRRSTRRISARRPWSATCAAMAWVPGTPEPEPPRRRRGARGHHRGTGRRPDHAVLEIGSGIGILTAAPPRTGAR